MVDLLTSMFVAEVGEPPDIAESHRVAETGEEEVTLVVPAPPVRLLLLLNVGHILFSLAFAHCDKIAWEQELYDANGD